MNDEIEDDYTIECPKCGEAIYDDAPQCPHCGQYITSADVARRPPTWFVIIVVLTIFAFLLPSIGGFLRKIIGQ